MTLPTGKLAAAPTADDLPFNRYRSPVAIERPQTFGHASLFPARGWGMLGNDEVGDCAIAGPEHETMLLTKLGGSAARFTTNTALLDYSSITGYDPNAGPLGENPTDQGSDVHAVAHYRRRVGMLDAAGARHRIGAYVWLEPGNWDELLTAMYLFEVVGMGFELPQSAEEAFHRNEVWGYEPGSPIVGGHYIAGVGQSVPGLIDGLSWGSLVRIDRRFYEVLNDETIAFISLEDLENGRSPEGFLLSELRRDLALV